MKVKTFPVAIAGIVAVFTGAIVIAKTTSPPEAPRPGTEHSDDGREHVSSKKYGGDQPPTSGPHADPMPWGVYDTEVRDDRTTHNLEHGGIYISYQPDLPNDQVEKLKRLLSAPFADKNFGPHKIVLAPRAANTHPIVLSSWLRSETLTGYDQQKIEDYVVRNLGKSPEPLAR